LSTSPITVSIGRLADAANFSKRQYLFPYLRKRFPSSLPYYRTERLLDRRQMLDMTDIRL
jgi:hypothetical protein